MKSWDRIYDVRTSDSGALEIREPALARAVLSDADTFRSTVIGELRAPALTGTLVALDQPEHAQLRHRVAEGIASICEPPNLHKMIRRSVDRLLGQLASEPSFDVVSQYARPLAASVVAEVVGFSEDSVPEFMQCSDAILLGDIQESFRAVRRVRAIARKELRAMGSRSIRPGLLATLCSAKAGYEPLSEPEVVKLVQLLVPAGVETGARFTTSLIFDLLQTDRSGELPHEAAVATHVQQVLATYPPVPFVVRKAHSSTAIGNIPVRAGQVLLVYLTDGDPSIKPGPLFFGHGPHTCLGRQIALTEAQTAAIELLRRRPNLRVVNFETGDNKYMDGLTCLRISDSTA